MKIKRPFAPGFVNKIDEHLLLNKPDTWSARTHLVLYYGLLFIIVLATICFFAPTDAREKTTIFIWSFFVGVLSVIGLVVWLIYLLRFNVFKRFGIVTPGDKIKTFFLYFVAIGIMVFAIYIPPIIESIKANRVYTSNELMKDVNDINIKLCQLNYDSLPHEWEPDTLIVRDTLPKRISEYNGSIQSDDIVEAIAAVDSVGIPSAVTNSLKWEIIDTAQLNSRIQNKDSLVKVNDSIYINYDCPSYTYVNSYATDFIYATEKKITNTDLYNRVIKNYVNPERKKTLDELLIIINKYAPDDYHSSDYYSKNGNYQERVRYKYKLSSVEESLRNISERKYRWHPYKMPFFIRLFYYSTLILTLLVFVFRHTTKKAFFLTLLVSIVLLILTSLFIAFFRITEKWLVYITQGYYVVFLFFAIKGAYSKTKSIASGIALNLSIFFVTIIPFLATCLYYIVVKEQRKNDIIVNMLDDNTIELRHYFYAEIIGTILLFILIETAFKFLYRKWYALPDL